MKKYITVFCGSSKGGNPVYEDKVKELALAMAEKDYHLVFGAGNVGLMGVIADELLSEKMEVIGVIPQHLVDMEVAHTGLTELIVTQTMHERKMIMAEKGSAFIAMPGGIGTLEEIVEVMTWLQLNLHNKPVAIYNVNGYYDSLLSFLQNMVTEKFLKQENLDQLIVETDPSKLIERIEKYQAEYIPKWQ